MRPRGRLLSDFEDLSTAETDLVARCRIGEIAVIGEHRPEREDDANRIRAELVRFLLLGGDDLNPVHEQGVQLRGAWLTGKLDLSNARVARHLLLWDCRIEEFIAVQATMHSLMLVGSLLEKGLVADQIHCEGNLILRQGFEATGPVRLPGATIEGDLDCADGTFRSADGPAVLCDGAVISGSMFLNQGFKAFGKVQILHSTIKRSFSCRGGKFFNKSGIALSCDGLTVGGTIFLDKGFSARGEVRFMDANVGGPLQCDESYFISRDNSLSLDRAVIRGSVFLGNKFKSFGTVRLLGAVIGGNLECVGGRFRNSEGSSISCDGAKITGDIFFRDGFHSRGEVRLPGVVVGGDLDCTDSSFVNEDGYALLCNSMSVAGTFYFRAIRLFSGALDLTFAHAKLLCDDEGSWVGADAALTLDGFTYGRMTGAGIVSCASRIRWLERQTKEHLAEGFRPQPWEQLASVLRATGNADDARTVAVAKHQQMRKAGIFVGGSKVWDWIYGSLVGYGYKPWRLVTFVAGVWLISTLAYWPAVNPQWFGAEHHLIAPMKSQGEIACEIARSEGLRQEPCPRPRRGYGDFFVPAYSAEVLLPVFTLGYKGEWRPVVSTPEGEWLPWGWVIRAIYWFEIVFGWLASLLLIAAVGNLVKKE